MALTPDGHTAVLISASATKKVMSVAAVQSSITPKSANDSLSGNAVRHTRSVIFGTKVQSTTGAVSSTGAATTTLSSVVHPSASVTVTVYTPGLSPVAVSVSSVSVVPSLSQLNV